jgi:hypothetical protein
MNELFDAAVTVPPKRRTLQASIPFIVWVCLDLLSGMSRAGGKSRGRAAIYRLQVLTRSLMSSGKRLL